MLAHRPKEKEVVDVPDPLDLSLEAEEVLDNDVTGKIASIRDYMKGEGHIEHGGSMYKKKRGEGRRHERYPDNDEWADAA